MYNSFFSSSTSEQRWVDQFNKHFIIYIGNRPSIFRVPSKVLETKPEAYVPRQLGLGAYHHFRPELDDDMESKKLEQIKKFLKPEQYNNFKNLIVDEVKELEQPIRACYNNYVDLDRDTLAWIMAIDGTYLLYLLSTSKSINRRLSDDVLKLENQIPAIVLKKINNVLRVTKGDEINSSKPLFSEFHNFYNTQSPLELCSESQIDLDHATSNHLLDSLYQLTMKNWNLPDFVFSPSKNTQENAGSSAIQLSLGQSGNQPLNPSQSSTTTIGLTESLIPTDEEPNQLLQQAATLLANLTGQKPLMLMAKLPLHEGMELFNLFKKVIPVNTVEEIKIPSVTQLHQITRIDFRKWTQQGIGIKYNEGENVLYLPIMKLNTNSEVILRNLKAYEEASASPGSSIKFSEYLDFMCGIIDTAKDVKFLKERAIIDSKMGNQEIADLFNGIQKSSRSDEQKDGIELTIDELNRGYDDSFRIKIWTFLRQHFRPSEVCVRIFLYVLIVVLLAFQAFCDVYGCSSRWFGKKS
ncbi:putative UPF0481 protein At3g02645 [Coffea arabica]|uniref:UPF0481 protein At3g02645 n=1 Tax=Coffea arabica TaxID=13443 RepID=A0A6P6WTS3_COFAR|nr:putative UPF0481 protein At3g02645 [Coffea arabica]